SLKMTWNATGEPATVFYGHTIELPGDDEVMFGRLHSAVRRGIRKAQSEGLRVEFGTSEGALKEFFYLHCLTRRRQGLPPQPFRFFENIRRHIFSTGQGFIATARLGKKPLAALVFLHSSAEAIYKFGASDFAYQRLRANNLVMWEAIRHCIKIGFSR